MVVESVQENKEAVIKYLLKTFDPSWGTEDPIYTPDGHFADARLAKFLISIGVTAWPRTESGRLQTDGDAFKLMYHVPGIEGLHALKDSLGVIVRAQLPIGPDGRNRPSLFPFATTTGRNAHAKSLFNAHAGTRGFMLFSPDKIPVYLDWRTQEIGVAAAGSKDPQLMHDYAAGDVYHALALMCGLTNDPDPKHWKENNKPMRQRMKQLQLGINYGMGVPSLARGLDRHPVIASTIIELHKRHCPRYWEWKDERYITAMCDRQSNRYSVKALHKQQSQQARALQFPDAVRWRGNAAVGGCAVVRGRPRAIHASARRRSARAGQRGADRGSGRDHDGAGRDVCDGFEIGVDVERMKDGRFRDKRDMAVKMWATIMWALQEVGALPEGQIP